jgi:hypothetical protein
MAFIHGKGAAALVGEFDLSAFLNNWEVAGTADTAEVTTFGGSSKSYIGGLKDATLSLSGFFDGAASAVDEVLAAALGGSRLFTLAPAGVGTVGSRVQIANALETSYNVTAPVADAVTISAEAQVINGVAPGVLLANLVARTAAGQTAAVDNAASTSAGYRTIIHLVAFTGTDVTVKVQESADNSSWADLVTFTQLTAIGSELKTGTGTVARYLRVDVAGTFTTVTFAVGFARL